TLRVIDELLWVLRRSGFAIATSQAIDVARAVRAVGFEDRATFRDAVAATVVTRKRDRARFDAIFDSFFVSDVVRGTLYERLAARGFDATAIDALRELLDALAASTSSSAPGADEKGGLLPLLSGGAELDRLLQLAGSARMLEGVQGREQLGFYT